MKISKNTSYTITFSVQYHEGTEGGMNSGSYGNEVNTMEEALEVWDLANIAEPRTEWVIVANVQKSITK